ncbi:MAG: ion transporter [Proteobacteria bacterium]|nr:ion transporter [Pseudomonadota bacterium]
MLKHLFIYSEEAAEKVDKFFEKKSTHLIISLLVFTNALIFGLEDIPWIRHYTQDLLEGMDTFILTVFIVEMISRMMVTRRKFFKNYWNVFDMMVTFISLLPASYGLETVRVLRVLHSMKMLEILPKTKHIIDALAHAIPGLLNVLFLSFVFYFVFSSIAVGLLGPHIPQAFGSLGSAMFHLFSIMTSGIWITYTQNLAHEAPQVGLFFIVFMIVVGYLIVNLFIGSVVAAVAKAERENEGEEESTRSLRQEVKALRKDIALLQASLSPKGPPKT